MRDQIWHADQKTVILPDGHLEMTLSYAGEGMDLLREVMKFGHEAEILEPKVLRDEVRRRLKLSLEQYGS